MEKQILPLIIVGNGIAGITTALTFRKHSKADVLVISDEHPYFFSRTALMYVYMGHMKWEHLEPYEPTFWEQQNIRLLQDRVIRLDSESKTIHCNSGESYGYDQLVLATGSKPLQFPWSGHTAMGIQGLYHKNDLERIEALTPSTTTAVVIGGGLIGVELAEMLHSRGIQVNFLIRESLFWDQVLSREEAQCVTSHIQEHGITTHCDTEVASFDADTEGRVAAVNTTNRKKINCQFVGITIGVSPQLEAFASSGLDTNKGILVDNYLRTNLKDVYAVGDCAELKHPPQDRKSIEAVWYSGRNMGASLGATLAGLPTEYQPGVWYNSAKFFDIEYQTYGNIKNKADAKTSHWFWKHPQKNISFRIAFQTNTRKFLGVSALGLRLRQEKFITWLEQQHTVDRVIQQLTAAHFDPEFSAPHLKSIQQEFLNQFAAQKVIQE